MPKGVEHMPDWKNAPIFRPVPTSVMPKGVELTEDGDKIEPVAKRADLCDAERR